MIGGGTRALLLASASPRRRQLLGAAGVAFSVEPSGVDEVLEGRPEPETAAEELALRKALDVASRHPGEELLVLGADTVVALGEGAEVELLGKPGDPGEAREMLEALSGSRHRVVTGVALVDARDPTRRLVEHERTYVRMRVIEPAEIEAYVASEEWRDKAGGYAIQESADAFVLALEGGGFDNVVGLPVARVVAMLERLGGGGVEPSS